MAQFVVEKADVSRVFSRNTALFSRRWAPSTTKIGAHTGKIGAQKAKKWERKQQKIFELRQNLSKNYTVFWPRFAELPDFSVPDPDSICEWPRLYFSHRSEKLFCFLPVIYNLFTRREKGKAVRWWKQKRRGETTERADRAYQT